MQPDRSGEPSGPLPAPPLRAPPSPAPPLQAPPLPGLAPAPPLQAPPSPALPRPRPFTTPPLPGLAPARPGPPGLRGAAGAASSLRPSGVAPARGGPRVLIPPRRSAGIQPATDRRCGMLRSTSTVTLLSSGGAAKTPGAPSRRANVCRLRLTVPPENPAPEQSEKKIERKEQHLDLSNGEPTRKLPRGVVYGVVRRSDPNQQKEMVVYGWSTSQLKEEMNYIKDVRATLEKVRKRMYGDYDEMRQKIQQLTQELSKTLVDVTLENSNIKDQIRNLQQTYEASMDKLREQQRQLEVAQVENQLLKMKVESSQEANAEVMREMTKKLYSQYQEKLQEEQRRHNAEKEALLEETNSFLKAIEEANKKMQAAEISLEEKDQRIGELDRLIERMEKERHQLQLQLLEHETEMSGEVPDADKERYQQLEEASASLRERIRHLDDMVHCQQKKVKQMVEEIESLKKKLQQKQLLILQLLEKVSFLEGENNELQSRLDYSTETQAKTEVETREIGVGCDLLPSQTGRTREIVMPSRNYTPYTRVLELTMKKTLT
uniref:Cingulin like 1 n=1 Tax=Callithrix jacchus TaxID=9483 RepID=A0A5F4W8A8_CALJA